MRETLVAVQQLDKNMCSLRSWLAHIETELTRPLVYDTCDAQEIQRKLNQQQVGGTHTHSERDRQAGKASYMIRSCGLIYFLNYVVNI